MKVVKPGSFKGSKSRYKLLAANAKSMTLYPDILGIVPIIYDVVHHGSGTFGLRG